MVLRVVTRVLLCSNNVVVIDGYQGVAMQLIGYSRWLLWCYGWLPGCCYVVTT